jgi:sugar-specific transcriptional regulator TrmB
MTGYAVAKETLVPQPKVYETLGRLVERGAVLQVSGSPAKFVAVAPARVLSELEREFRQRLATVELEVSRMRRESDQVQELRLYKETNSWIEIVSAASHLISGAAERIYVCGHGTSGSLGGRSSRPRRSARIGAFLRRTASSLHNGIVIRHAARRHRLPPSSVPAPRGHLRHDRGPVGSGPGR